ncbi:tRNA (guanosine(18)-2'-O)-methyltransferase TrmH [Aestuariicella sp. G3-2]|uniref:tRNA (guanosine(18)-2'-O)-methyltransferase TrmH n=1 Tax=Pseudomaricurvus albidus TaxID=2842452 RepID=UPI001C0CF6C9|nr:tRNA (guanosine(18)-2'-O)-methyltransferase TrmH [Aestuariicella albida]MBU3070549.1 tRNA (guanosine(18)-2'-O)-methyltransferase TrmH [Aestuariicella albida]
MTPERFETICKVLSQRQPDLTVITDEVHKGRNLSAIVRTCDAVGIQEFHCVEPRKGYRAFRGTALGSHKWVDTVLHSEVSTGINHLKQKGFKIVAAHLSDAAVDFREVDYTVPTALLMGTEKEGVSTEALALVDEEVVIPMMGMVESFNVSVACAIILTEVQRQRKKAGLYDTRRLSDEVYNIKLFQWCQPVVTKFCDERGLEYPPIDEEGEIINPADWYRKIREAAK